MKRILNSEIFSLARLILIIGVLSAIVFSNGEGISLLPFSNFDSDSQISLKKSSEDTLDAYVFSVHGAGKLRNSFVSKHQKNLKNFSLASFYPNFYPQNDLQNDFFVENQNFDESDLLILTGVLSKPSARAPPAV